MHLQKYPTFGFTSLGSLFLLGYFFTKSRAQMAREFFEDARTVEDACPYKIHFNAAHTIPFSERKVARGCVTKRACG